MTIKVYFNNDDPDMAPPAWRGTNWDKTTGAVVKALGLDKVGPNASVAQSETSTSSTYDMVQGSWTSAPFLRDASIAATETIGLTVGRQASAASSFYSVIYIYVMAPDGSVRGVLQNKVGSSYWGTGQANGGWNPGVVSAVSAQAGDRLVFEMGVRAANTTSSSRTATIWYGDGGGADYDVATPDQSGVTTRVGNAVLTGSGLESLWTPPPLEPGRMMMAV
ncbi:hypothetical protein [Pseudonocardia sp. D17]|uniref:hypothetical protein n=1 Tax=Pseudonocardia sp. D17 TaxID=882661 RepID=UPI002B378CB6|nr:hypothetical protein PSD17_39320 [Pseudonocardia sp. D17]